VVDFAKISYKSKNGEDIISLNTSYIPMNLFPDIIEDVKSKKPSYDMLRGKYPLLPAKTKSTLEIIYTEQYEAQYLMVQPGQALFMVSNIIFSKKWSSGRICNIKVQSG